MRFEGILLTALAAVFWSGCSQQSPTSPSAGPADGSAASMTQEISDMGSSVEFSQFGGMAKQMETATADSDTITINAAIVRRPWTYNDGWWVREIEVMVNQYSYDKIDSVRFHDADNSPVQVPGWSTVRGWTHYRHVELVGARATHRLDFAMEAALDVGLQKIATWNGTITGRLNGIELSSATVTNVVRTRGPGFWRFPESGTIHVERSARTVDISFTGNGGATAVVTQQGQTTIITIDIMRGIETVSN